MIKEQSYLEVLEYLRNIPNTNGINTNLIRLLTERALRKYTEERRPRYISEAAKIEAVKHNVQLNINTHNGIHKPRKMGVMITLDHCNPVGELVDRIMIKNNIIKDVLNDNFTAIITKNEDDSLNKLGYRRKRGKNGKKYSDCYIEAGIQEKNY